MLRLPQRKRYLQWHADVLSAHAQSWWPTPCAKYSGHSHTSTHGGARPRGQGSGGAARANRRRRGGHSRAGRARRSGCAGGGAGAGPRCGARRPRQGAPRHGARPRGAQGRAWAQAGAVPPQGGPWAVRHLPLRRQPPADQLHDRARPPRLRTAALQAAARQECRPVRTLACCARAAGAGQSRACSHLGIFFSACSAVRGRTLQMCGRTLRSCASGPSTATARSPTATRTSSRRCSATTSCPRGALAGRHGLSYTPWCLDRLYRTHRHPKVRCLRPMRGLAHGPVHTELSARLEVAVPRTAL